MIGNNTKAIWYGGFIASTLDIIGACVTNWRDPIYILHVVASGALGTAAYTGGLATAASGMLLQWLMGIIIASIYVLASRQLSLLIEHWMTSSLLYGLIIFVVMNYVVVPLSRAGFMPGTTLSWFATNIALMLLFGFLIGFFAQHYTRPQARF